MIVTSHAPPDRAPAFAALDQREGIELALFGGRVRHGVPLTQIGARPLQGARPLYVQPAAFGLPVAVSGSLSESDLRSSPPLRDGLSPCCEAPEGCC